MCPRCWLTVGKLLEGLHRGKDRTKLMATVVQLRYLWSCPKRKGYRTAGAGFMPPINHPAPASGPKPFAAFAVTPKSLGYGTRCAPESTVFTVFCGLG